MRCVGGRRVNFAACLFLMLLVCEPSFCAVATATASPPAQGDKLFKGYNDAKLNYGKSDKNTGGLGTGMILLLLWLFIAAVIMILLFSQVQDDTEAWRRVNLDKYPHLVVAFPSLRQHAMPTGNLDRRKLGPDLLSEKTFVDSLTAHSTSDDGRLNDDAAREVFMHYSAADLRYLYGKLRNENPSSHDEIDRLMRDFGVDDKPESAINWPKKEIHAKSSFISGPDDDAEAIKQQQSAGAREEAIEEAVKNRLQDSQLLANAPQQANVDQQQDDEGPDRNAEGENSFPEENDGDATIEGEAVGDDSAITDVADNRDAGAQPGEANGEADVDDGTGFTNNDIDDVDDDTGGAVRDGEATNDGPDDGTGEVEERTEVQL